MTVHWYPPETPPDYNMKVRALADGREFDAVCVLHRLYRRPRWARLGRKRRLEWLRDAPEAWRADDPAYVPPVHKSPPAGSLERFAAKPAATPSPEPEGRHWWLDANMVRTSPPGAVTPRECEGRLMRALWTARVERMPDPRGPGSNSDWIYKMVVKHEIEEGIRERATYWHDKFMPTPRDVSDCPVALEWLDPILHSKRDRAYDVVVLRSANPAYSWVQIGHELKMTSSRAARLYRHAIALATYRANNVKPKGRHAT